ncbi:MAG: hypothetical protein R3E97_14220 [Candidatus Eisenbacteria bacterium]
MYPRPRPLGANQATRSATSSATSDRPNPLHINRVLWVLLGVATVFLVGVQLYLRTSGQVDQPTHSQVAEMATLSVISPVMPVRAPELRLSWDRTAGAVNYLVRIHALNGTPVVDPMIVWGENWRPSEELLPGLQSGPYRWTVEAVDGAGRVLARSLVTEFEIS